MSLFGPQKTVNPVLALIKGSRHYYIKQSHQILKKYGVPLLDDIADANRLAKSGDALHNLRWAYNGQGTHTTKTIKAVYEQISKARSKKQLQSILDGIGDILEQGNKLY